jgi:hypothetical protein
VATSDLRDQLQTALGTQCSIERELGRGGMATVRATDRPVRMTHG